MTCCTLITGIALCSAPLLRAQCGSSVLYSYEEPVWLKVIPDSVVALDGLVYRVYSEVPADLDRTYSIDLDSCHHSAVAYHANGQLAIALVHTDRSMRITHYDQGGRLKTARTRNPPGTVPVFYDVSEFDSTGMLTSRSMRNDSVRLDLLMRSATDTVWFHRTLEYRPKDRPYSVHISAQCGDRMEVRFFPYSKNRVFYEIFLGYARVGNGTTTTLFSERGEAEILMDKYREGLLERFGRR